MVDGATRMRLRYIYLQMHQMLVLAVVVLQSPEGPPFMHYVVLLIPSLLPFLVGQTTRRNVTKRNVCYCTGKGINYCLRKINLNHLANQCISHWEIKLRVCRCTPRSTHAATWNWSIASLVGTGLSSERALRLQAESE